MANPLERRDFLKLAGAGAVGVGLPAWLAEVNLSPEKEKALAWGLLLSTEGVDPSILEVVTKPDFQVPENLTQYGYIEVTGTRRYDYLIKTKRGLAPIPLELVLVLGGNPFPIKKRSYFLGIRNDLPELMPYVDLAGMTPVRIARDVEEIGNRNSKLERAIVKALELKFRPLVVFNTRYPRPEVEVRAMIRLLLRYDVDVELLNEPNDAPFWKDGDLETASELVSVATNEIKKQKPKARVIVGALTDPAKMKPFVGMLRNHGVNLTQVEFAAHGYQTPEVVETMVNAVVAATGKPAVVTEVGVRGANKRVIVPILDRLWQLGRRGRVSQVFIHELPNFEEWGFYNPYLSITESYFYYLPAWIKLHGG